jgi:hypothetical protein
MNRLIGALVLVAASSSAFADQLVVTGEKAGRGGAIIALDYASTGQATGFEFKIAVPGGESAKVDLSNCLKGLPKSHAGQCNFAKGMIIGMAYSDTNALLPTGVLQLGTVSFSSLAKGAPQVIHFLAANTNGDKIESGVELGSDVVEKNMAE